MYMGFKNISPASYSLNILIKNPKVKETFALVVFSCLKPGDLDLDMVVDASLLLWNKCKAVFQRYQTGSIDNARYLQKMESPGKVMGSLHIEIFVNIDNNLL